MPRTFTLQRLMLAITLFCILCGLAVGFPQLAFRCMIACMFLGVVSTPTVVVWIVLVKVSRQPVKVWVASAFGAYAGACAGQLVVPGVFTRVGWHGFTADILILLLILATLPAIGALLIGGLMLIGDILTCGRGR